MSVVVLAYHEMGCLGLRVLLDRGVRVSAVFTHRDDPGENRWFGSVADLAWDRGVLTFTTENINAPRWVEYIRRLEPTVIFSFWYRQIVRRPILDIPKHGCVNMHGSLLPRYRGRCPINWQLINGETTSGVTLHYMTERADAGDIIDQESVTVGPDDTALDLYRKLLPVAEGLLTCRLTGILIGGAPRRPQDESQATKFGGRRPEDGRIDWHRPAREIHNLVRAVAPPWPGAFSDFGDARLMVYKSRPGPRPAEAAGAIPGQVLRVDDAYLVVAGDGVLELLAYDVPGGQELADGLVLGAAEAKGGNRL